VGLHRDNEVVWRGEEMGVGERRREGGREEERGWEIDISGGF
jgi:hypothetical protein